MAGFLLLLPLLNARLPVFSRYPPFCSILLCACTLVVLIMMCEGKRGCMGCGCWPSFRFSGDDEASFHRWGGSS